MRRLLYLIAATFGFAAAPLSAGGAAPAEEAALCDRCEAVLALALANPRRDADRARDIYRHPAETIAFFRIRPGMTVADFAPSGGWYTRILVPYLGPGGSYIGLNAAPPAGDARLVAATADFPAKAAAWTGAPAGRIAAYASDALPPALTGTVDRVMIMREVHNLIVKGALAGELGAIHALLKPDGLLGIEEHRARSDAPDAYADGGKGYVREADVIKAIESHGFKLVARSEVNANPNDPANWPAGVWTLPPTLSQGDADRARYQAIGESDRMTLLFARR